MFSGSELTELGALARSQKASKAIFGWKQLGKYALSGMENVASKLNYYDGHLKWGQAGVFFGAGLSFGLTSYSLSRAGNEIPSLFRIDRGYGFSSVMSPLLSYGIAEMTSGFLNYYGSKNIWKVSFKDLYPNIWKSSLKVFSYTGSSFWGFGITNNGFN